MPEKEKSVLLREIMRQFPNGLFYFNLECRKIASQSLWLDHIKMYALNKFQFQIQENGRVIIASHRCENVVDFLKAFSTEWLCHFEGYYWQFPLHTIHLIRISHQTISFGRKLHFSKYQQPEHLAFLNENFSVYLSDDDFWYVHHHRYFPYKKHTNKINQHGHNDRRVQQKRKYL